MPGDSVNERYFMTATTPTTRIQVPRNCKRRPIGESLGQYRRASARLTMATAAEVSASPDVKSRPESNGTASVRK